MRVPATLYVLIGAYLANASFADKVKRDGPTPTTCHTALITPKPSHAACGIRGILKKPDPITSVKYPERAVHPFNLCRSYCLETKNCISFSFDKNNDKCVLYRKDLASMGIERKQNDILYYNHNCFARTCSPVPPPTCGTAPHSVTFNIQVSGGPFNGEYGAITNLDDQSNGRGVLYLTPSLDSAATFTFSAYCDLVGYNRSSHLFYGAVDEISDGPLGSGSGFIEMNSEQVYDVSKEEGLITLSCGLEQGSDALDCVDEYDNAMFFFACLDPPVEDPQSRHVFIGHGASGECSDFVFTTTSVTTPPPAPT